MIEIYTGQEYEAELKVKKRLFSIWLTLFIIYAAICITLAVIFSLLPYGTRKTPFITVNIALSSLFWGFSLLFFNTKYYRLRKYVKMLEYLITGLKDNYSGQFLRYDDTVEVKDGVEFYKMITKEWNQRKQEYFERKVLIDKEKPKPQIPENAYVKYVTQGNILIKYKIIRQDQNESDSIGNR
jgi:hypothetical protein